MRPGKIISYSSNEISGIGVLYGYRIDNKDDLSIPFICLCLKKPKGDCLMHNYIPFFPLKEWKFQQLVLGEQISNYKMKKSK